MNTPAMLTACLALLCAPVQSAQLYRCTVDGATGFSDRPCGNDAQVIEVKPQGSQLTDAEAAEINRKRMSQAWADERERSKMRHEAYLQEQKHMVQRVKDRYRAIEEGRAEARDERAVRALERMSRYRY